MPTRRTTVLALTGLTALTLSACSGGGTEHRGATSAGNPDACPGELVDVVVSVAQWGTIVERLAGDCADVTTVLASATADPHSFEPTTGDIAAFSSADLVVVNGAGYDSWAEAALSNVSDQPVVVDVAEVAGLAEEHTEDEHTEEEHGDEEHAEDEHGEQEHGHTHGGTDPHLWYEPAVVQDTAAAVTEALTDLSPDAADHFAERAADWDAELAPYLAAVEELRPLAEGRSYAATETVFDRMAAAVGLTDVTPEGYRRSAANDGEPAPGELAAFRTALADGSVDVLVHNSQTSGSVPDQLVAAAEDAGVPVVAVTESPRADDGSFVAWQVAQLQALIDALQAAP